MAAQGFNPVKISVTLAINYLRWLQLTPMITVWAFAIVMLAALLFVNHQEEGFTIFIAVTEWLSQAPLIGEKYNAWLESLADEDGSVNLGGAELKAAALRVWSLLSLAFMLIALMVNLAFGPFKPWPLKRKLGIALLCCLALLAAYFSVYLTHPEEFNGPLSSWIFTFGGINVLLFIVSAWCLSIAHLLGLLNQSIEASSLGSRTEPQPPYTVKR